MSPKINSSSSDLFKFVQVRAPKMDLYHDPKNNTRIYYPHDLFEKLPKTLESEYVKNKKDDSPIKTIAAAKKIYEEYRTSDLYFKSSSEVNKKYPGFLEFKNWLDGVKSVDANHIEEKVKLVLNSSPENLLKDLTLFGQAWDNYLINVVDQANPDTLQSLTEIIRVYEVLRILVSKERTDFNKVERATIVLPKTIFPLPVVENNTANSSTSGVMEEKDRSALVSVLMKKIHLAEQAQKELGDLYETESNNVSSDTIVKENTEEQNELQQIENLKVDKLTVSLIDSLSKESKSLVSDLRISAEKTTFSVASERLRVYTAELYTELAPFLRSKRTVKVVGNAIVEIDESEQNSTVKSGSEKNRSNNSNDPFGSIYNSLFAKNPDMQLDLQIGEFKTVEHELKCYEAGEIAHIENVLRGEEKIRETRRLNRTEEFTSISSETTEEQEKDVQSTDRFEMQKETSKVIETDTSFEAGVTVSATYGPVSLGTNAAFSTGVSTSQSVNNAIEYAKSVTERARDLVIRKVKETRTITNIREFEEKNTHKLLGGTNDHTVGIYRWVDKTYKARLLNKGKRLMMNINIPEPSSYYIYSQKFAQESNLGAIDIPNHPSDEIIQNLSLNSFHDISTSNYGLWAALYGAEVAPPPKSRLHIGTSIDDKKAEEQKRHSERISTGKDTLSIPANYRAKKVYVRSDFSSAITDGGWPMSIVYVGNEGFFHSAQVPMGQPASRAYLQSVDNVDFDHYADNKIPIVYRVMNSDNLISNIVIECELTNTALTAWKIETYTAIMDAYQAQRQAAENAIAQLQAMAGVQISGRNPKFNQQVVTTELKKYAMEIIRTYSSPFFAHNMQQVYSHISNNPNMPDTITEFNNEPWMTNPYEAIKIGKYVNFMEEAFEWGEMTYRFRDYFWARHRQWKTLFQLEDNDPLFQSFLKAGYASLVLPVKPGYEKHVMYYIRTGKLWLGGDTPAIDQVLDHYIDDELGDQDPLAEPVVEACWDYTLPTNTVILQKDASGIEGDGLPCFDVPCKK